MAMKFGGIIESNCLLIGYSDIRKPGTLAVFSWLNYFEINIQVIQAC
jgi:hypothetical protein